MKKSVNIYHRLLFIFALGNFLFLSTLYFIYTFIGSINLKMTLILVILLAYLFFLIWFKPRHYFHLMKYKFDRLRTGSEKPIVISSDPQSNLWLSSLINKGFVAFQQFDGLTLFHRYTTDSKGILLKQPTLDIVVVITNNNITYRDYTITKFINKIEEYYFKQKKRILNYHIIEIMSTSNNHQFDKDTIDEVTFEKNNQHNVTVINCHYNKNSRQLYFLHNKSYSPSKYYTYAVSLIEYIFDLK